MNSLTLRHDNFTQAHPIVNRERILPNLMFALTLGGISEKKCTICLSQLASLAPSKSLRSIPPLTMIKTPKWNIMLERIDGYSSNFEEKSEEEN